MSYVTYPHCYRTDDDFRPIWLTPAVRAVGDGLAYLGGGILFAATVYVMIALPGLIG